MLTERLLEAYRRDHEVIVYEAAILPACGAKIARIALERLPDAPITIISMLYVPRMTDPQLDTAMLNRLGMSHTIARA